MKRTALRRHTPLRSKRNKPDVRIGRVSGKVRLSGGAMKPLREACWIRDGARCRECGGITFWKPRYDGDPLAYDMAHIKSRGSGGSDTLENVKTMHHKCHMAEHTRGEIG